MIFKISLLPDAYVVAYPHSYLQLKEKITVSWPKTQKIIGQLVIALLAGWVCSWLKIPVGWLLGPMLAGIAYAIKQGSRQPLPPYFKLIAQIIIGMVTASRFSLETVMIAKTYFIPLLLCVCATGGLSMFNGYLLSRWAGIDQATGFLGFIPGAASSIVAMSEEMGADAIAVALIQYIRVLLVVLLLPATATFLFPVQLEAQTAANVAATTDLSTLPLYLNLLIVAICGGLGIWLGKRLKFPSAGFLGPFFVGLIVFWLLPYSIEIPRSVFNGGLLLLGISIGVQFDWEVARKLLKAVYIEIALVCVLSLICLGIGYEFHVLTGVETSTAILGFTPGGIEAMIATVMQLGGDTGLVLAMQLTRMLGIILIAPWLVGFLAKRVKSSHAPEAVPDSSPSQAKV
ncbi:AbrB family transcriptional regulator [Gloeothece verrucosa]|uniref:Membrane protein AbrB duplication n=1 Tax=Gloeothece verrucosa (strain PCC 7822) TaxID=497965 RepID=E0U8N4_GLOV7|nr:AbrB family transcriptional regulator [Gloeothece verrucosa]ADN13780.1 membrane protein AbrB duplication [Gloeothece verrucosa PCC 7822]